MTAEAEPGPDGSAPGAAAAARDRSDLQEARVHRAFGLTIASRLPLPELPEGAEGDPDVEIVPGHVPPELPDAVRKGVRFQVAPGRLWLQVAGV